MSADASPPQEGASRRKRGRPPHPDILTSREWEVLAFLRQGLTNEQIALHLDVSLATAKYHVSEILSKLNVPTREQAAAWQPEPAPVSHWQRLVSLTPLAKGAGVALAAATVVALGALAYGVWRTSGDNPPDAVAQPTTTIDPSEITPTPMSTAGPLPIEAPEPFIQGQFPWRHALYAINPDTAELEILLDGVPTAYDWSPDGTQIAYVSNYASTIHFLAASGASRGPMDIHPIRRANQLSWSPDGAHIAVMGYVEDEANTYQVSSVAFLNIESGGLDFLYKPPQNFAPQTAGYDLFSSLEWNQDGKIAVELRMPGANQGASAVLLDVDGTTEALSDPSAVYAVPAHPDATLSPDGQSFAYFDNSQTIRIARRDGSEDRVLATGQSPDWSPDGQRIAFARDSQIFVINADGTQERQLTGSVIPQFGVPRWSPDGGRVLFAYRSTINIFVVPSAGGIPKYLAPGYGADWARDGSRIAFLTLGFFGVGGGGNLSTMRPDASEIVRLPARLGFSDAISYCGFAERQWSPDSSRIGYGDDFQGVAIVSSAGDSLPQPLNASCLAFSPDLSQFAIAVRPSLQAPCTVRVFGMAEIVEPGSVGCFPLPEWSPDGRLLAYWSDLDLMIAKADGSQTVKAISVDGDLNYTGGLAWSPDSRRVAFVADETVQIVDADGAGAKHSLANPSGEIRASNGRLSWSPDGSLIAFTTHDIANTWKSQVIYVTASDGSGEPVRLARGHDPEWSPDSTQVAFTAESGY